MPRHFTDARLRALTGRKCAACERMTARGTGNLGESRDGSGWLYVEYVCDACGETFSSWGPDVDALVQQIVRDHTRVAVRPGSAMVSGEIGHDGPVARPPAEPPPETPSEPALLRLRETASELACATRRAFVFTATAAGGLTHEEVPSSGTVRSRPLRHDIEAPDVLASLHALFERADLQSAPPEIGQGAHHIELEWRGANAPVTRTLRWTQRGSARDFGGDREITRARVDLVDGLWQLLQWVDAGGPAPRWPDPTKVSFPRAEDLLRRARAARLSVTHDWDGSKRNLRVRECWASDSGTLELRVLRLGNPRPTVESSQTRALPDARALFDQLAALHPMQFRERLGFVRTSCGLDTIHDLSFEYFDGERLHGSTLVYGSERGLGTSYGDMPPRPDEAAAFELLGKLMRSL